MKTSSKKCFVLTTAIALAGQALLAQEIVPTGVPVPAGPDLNVISSRSIEMKPTDKRPLSVNDQERNPYAARTADEEEVVDNNENSQENQIRERLLKMPIGGSSVSSNGIKILVGDISIEKGKTLSHLIPDQTENLKVIEISDSEINFGWLDIETGELTGKTMQIAYDLRPGVRFLLPGQKDTKAPKMGYIDVEEQRKRAAEEYQKINPKNQLPSGIYERAQ